MNRNIIRLLVKFITNHVNLKYSFILQFSNRLLGLFANAIVNGGNALCDMFHQSNPQEAAVELASRLDCTSEKGEDILRCLSTQTQQEIVLKQSAMFVSLINFVEKLLHRKISLILRR